MEELVKSTADIALARGAKMISAGHLKACITSNEKFDFLEEIVQGVPDLPAADEAKPASTKTAKRERAAPDPATEFASTRVAREGEPCPGQPSLPLPLPLSLAPTLTNPNPHPQPSPSTLPLTRQP